ncbi:MAG: hypothetical protein Q7K03_01475 [Dehalococcoidia bacterium]|nr:hypothetical protein [Dehalococcoidia bacterium]
MTIFKQFTVQRALGAISFGAGLVLAILAGWLWPQVGWLAAILTLLGLVVGILNISGREVIPFLVATIALVVIGQGNIFDPLNDFAGGLGTGLNNIVDKIALFAAPAGLVNAVRAAITLARPGQSLK